MIVIVAEKPSAARNFAQALGGMQGAWRGERYRIVALHGHVRTLRPPEDQVGEAERDRIASWELDDLGWDASRFQWRKATPKGCGTFLIALHDALQGASEAVIATDDDPTGEGEVIAWEALECVKWAGRVTRMYFEDESPGSVRRAFEGRVAIESMQRDGDYVKGHLRERWDLLSMQFTRACTAVARQKGPCPAVRQGRLKSVVVSLVGAQQAAYEGYVRRPYYEARFRDGNGNIFARQVEDPDAIRFPDPSQVDLSGLAASKVEVDSRRRKAAAPGALLDLSALSAILARRGFSPDAVLKTYQAMYEAQVVSYPRTEDRTVTAAQYGQLLPLAPRIAAVVGVDPSLLTRTEPRPSHIGTGLAHGANRPGAKVPESLGSLRRFGECGPAIYEVLARGYLSILCEDYAYDLVKAHVAGFPEYVSESRVPVPGCEGFKAVFDRDAALDGGKGEGAQTGEFGATAAPYVHEGAPKRPQRPTMAWLSRRLERLDVGTGATRTGTVADVSAKGDPAALLVEAKGVLSLTELGKVGYLLAKGTRIADPDVTRSLHERMEAAGRFEADPEEVLAEVAGMVMADAARMQANLRLLDEAGVSLAAKGREPVGRCPRCGGDVVCSKRVFYCTSIRFAEQGGKVVKADEGCGFSVFRTIAGKQLTEGQVSQLLEKGATRRLKGFKRRDGGTFEARIGLDADACRLTFLRDRRP